MMTHNPIRFIVCIIILINTTGLFAQYEGDRPADKLNYTAPNPYETLVVEPSESTVVKNVILMIGDGMGFTQVSTAWVANRGKLNMDNLNYSGMVRTYAANRLITDSGASGTAMATGQKTSYHSVGVDMHGKPLPSLIDLSNEKGLATAVVVTCGLTDATPAAFCASHVDRDMEMAIALDYLNCNADYILGGGRRYFSGREDGRDVLNEMQQAGYQVTTNWEETRKIASGKVFAVLENGQLPLASDRGGLWQEAVMHALQLVSQHENGFFAMFEGSRIDDAGHWHDIPVLVQEIFDFDQTIGKVLQWAEKDGETLVIVLADHETGGLTLLDGDIASGYVKGHFSTGGHSNIMVPVFAWGPQANQFTGVFENTEIFHKIAQVLNVK